jgi:heme/copper-type cytochrome/quinol oxidase subunit 3
VKQKFLKMKIKVCIMSNEAKGYKEVDTLRVALLGFSLVSAVVFAYLIAYFMMYSFVDYPNSKIAQFSPEQLWTIQSIKVFLICMFILPLITSFVVWAASPAFIKGWYSLGL